jgi:hypothetical protein
VLSNPVRPQLNDIIDEAWGDQVADMVVRRYPDVASRDADLGAFTAATLAGQLVAIVPALPGVPYLQQHNGAGWITVDSALPAPLGATDPLTTFTDPTGEVWIAKGGVHANGWRRARDVLGFHVFRNAAYGWATGANPLQFDSKVDDDYVLYNSGANASVPMPVAGYYLIAAGAAATGTGGHSMQLNLMVAGAAVMIGSLGGAGTWGQGPTVAGRIKLSANQTIGVQYLADAALTGQPGKQQSFLTVQYLGSSA